MQLPKFLLEQIQRGRVVLFLGAGASFGSSNRLGESPPMATALAALLSKEAGIEFVDGEDDLSIVSANAKKRLGDQGYQEFLRDRYLRCKASADLKHLAHFPWARIYSINIDDALEDAFRGSEYELEVSVHSSPVTDKPRDGAIQLVKLNGSIDRFEAGLIFTPEEYLSHFGEYGKWYEKCASDFLQYTFLFIGTKLNEPLFRHQVDRLIRLKGQRPGTSYIVSPSFSENKRLQLADENIEALPGTTSELVQALVAALGPKVSMTQMLKLQHPNLQQLIAKVPAHELPKVAAQLDNLELVVPDQLRVRIPAAKPGVRDFYYGSEPTWRDILDEVPATLVCTTDLIKAVEGNSRVTLLHGPAGCGKSTAMMSSAYSYALRHPESFVIWVRRISDFPRDAISELCASGVNEVVVFVDDYAVHAGDIIKLLGRALKNLRFVISERSNLIPSSSGDYHVAENVAVRMSKLGAGDADALLLKLEQFGPWDRLGRISVHRRRKELEVIGDKQLLVGLREATQGIGYDKIVASEFERLQGAYAKSAYTVIALASMHRLDISTATFDLAMRALVRNEEIPAKRLAGLEEVAFNDGGWFRVRHQILAEFTISRVVETRKVLNSLDAILKAHSRYGSPLRKYANKGEQRLFAALTNHDFLWRIFRDVKGEVLAVFAKWERAFANDGLFWLQYALFEERCGVANLEAAVNHIRTALRIYPESFQIINAYANIHFALALHSKTAEEALLLMEQATQSIRDQEFDTHTEAYTAVALAKGRIGVLKRWYPARVKDELREAEARLREVFRHDPKNRRVQDAINQLNLEAANGSKKSPAKKSWRRRGRTQK